MYRYQQLINVHSNLLVSARLEMALEHIKSFQSLLLSLVDYIQ